jgi:hypothetical protein
VQTLLRHLAAPNFSEEPAFFQVLSKTIVDDLRRFFPDIGALLARHLDSARDGGLRHDQATVDQRLRIGVVRGLQRVLIVQFERFTYRCLPLVQNRERNRDD